MRKNKLSLAIFCFLFLGASADANIKAGVTGASSISNSNRPNTSNKSNKVKAVVFDFDQSICDQNSQPFEGVRDSILKLKNAGFVVGVISNKPRLHIHKFTHRHAFHLFDFIHYSHLPSHLAMKQVMEENSLSNNELVFVSHDPNKMSSIDRMKIKVIHAKWGSGPKVELLEHTTAEHPSHLIQYLLP